jgi:hypothetical protein
MLFLVDRSIKAASNKNKSKNRALLAGACVFAPMPALLYATRSFVFLSALPGFHYPN